MAEYRQTESFSEIIVRATEYCVSYRHEFVMPEHLLFALGDNVIFTEALKEFYSPQAMSGQVKEFLDKLYSIPSGIEYSPGFSEQMYEVMGTACKDIELSSAESADLPHLVHGLLELKESWAAYILRNCLNGNEANFISQLICLCNPDESLHTSQASTEKDRNSSWRELVTCMNDHYQEHNPLIGREMELKRTIQVLCRRDKNNPLHIGESGVGKTALVWGLVRLIAENKIPKRLKGCRVYQLDMGTLLAGTQYRGDFESRIKQIMDGVIKESDNNIVYIDEIHTLVGAGATGQSAMDASNMLKPYLETGKIRFIGSTTYEEYNRHFSHAKGLLRRFQQIDIMEPSVNETEGIIRQLKPYYEEFHNIKYSDEAISYAVEASSKHINDRFLPDKAIDLIDEAGAAVELEGNTKIVGKKEIAVVLSKICKVESLSDCQDNDNQRLESLAGRMLSQIYGQDEAIRQVVEAVQMSKAGLLDDNKPLASLLFLGPTGVGKTEVARVLSKELGIALVRFDMSEYTEKHTVAKLIGSPAGYVGYEDGGLLTDAIRNNPSCVLLLDEIEKAHQDIYNILLQVMDYARLTDNRGRHSDFRNVVLIMTSNAGAQFASKGSIGFSNNMSRGDIMMKQVKKTFKPEFLNRLSGTVIFHDMDMQMATLILQKKLRELDIKLNHRQVQMRLTQEAFKFLLEEGFTAEYGAREIDRVISQKLKPLLMREILFGSLQKGGSINIDIEDGCLSVK